MLSKTAANKYIIVSLMGMLMGLLFLHPFAMVIEGLTHPEFTFRPSRLVEVFNIHHLPMAAYFSLLGIVFGSLIIHYTMKVSKTKTRLNMLERLLPICAYCKKIRHNETADGTERWDQIEHYITERTSTTFTHGICPECYEVAMEKLNREDHDTCITTDGQGT